MTKIDLGPKGSNSNERPDSQDASSCCYLGSLFVCLEVLDKVNHSTPDLEGGLSACDLAILLLDFLDACTARALFKIFQKLAHLPFSSLCLALNLVRVVRQCSVPNDYSPAYISVTFVAYPACDLVGMSMLSCEVSSIHRQRLCQSCWVRRITRLKPTPVENISGLKVVVSACVFGQTLNTRA